MKLAKIALTPPLSAISVFAFFALTLSTFGFDYSSTITASGYAGEETLQNFPVLVKISPETIQGFDYSQLKHGNADIAFVSMDGGTEYSFEIDTWDTSGTSFVWVKLPELTAATQFKFLWGDESVTASAANAHAVWGSAAGGSYLGVWHMNGGDGADESDSAGTVTDVDMTFAAKAGTGGDTSRMTSVAGMVGTGRSIDSNKAMKDKGNYFLCSDFASAGMGTTFTISYWERPHVIAGWNDILDRQSIEGEGNKWRIRRLSDRLYWYYSGQSNVSKGSGYPWAIGKWTFVTLSIDGKNVKMYGNGELMQTATGGMTPNNGPLAIANRTSGEGTSAAAEYDELRILNGIAASGDWVKAEYDTVATAGFLAYGPAAMQTARGLTVTAVPEEIGVVSPAYGKYKTLADGSTTVCTAPSAEWDITDQKHAHFTGWKYYIVDEDGLYQLADEGDTLIFSYKQEGDKAAKLEWQIAYRWTADVTVTIPDEDDGKGTVSGGGSHNVGETVTLTAIPKDGETFYYWEGDLPEGVAPSSPTLTFTLGENGASFTPHFTGRTARWKSPVDGNWTDATKWEDGVVPDNDGTVDIVFPAKEKLYSVVFRAGVTKVRGITHEYVSETACKTKTGPNWSWTPTAGSSYLEIGAGGFTAVSDKGLPWCSDSRAVITLKASQTWLLNSTSTQSLNVYVHNNPMSVEDGVVWSIIGTGGYGFNNSTDVAKMRGRIRTNSGISGIAGLGTAMDGFEWFNTADATTGGLVPGDAGKKETTIAVSAKAGCDFNAEMKLDLQESGAAATFTYGVDAAATTHYYLTNKWSGVADIGTKFSLKFNQSYGSLYPGKQSVRFGNDASTLTFGGTAPGVSLYPGIVELVSNNALGRGNDVPVTITGNHMQGYFRGLLAGDGIAVRGKIYIGGGLYAYNILGTTVTGATASYEGDIGAVGDCYPCYFVAGDGSVVSFNGKVTAKGNEAYKGYRYVHVVNGAGTVVFNGDNSGVASRFRVRSGTMGLGHEYAGGKNKEILVGDIVPTNMTVRCVCYTGAKSGKTIDGKYVVSNATAGQPFVYDGVTLGVGDRVLVAGADTMCGVFEVTAIDQMTRLSTDWFQTDGELHGGGSRVYAEEGNTFAGSSWMMFSGTVFMYEPTVGRDPEVGLKTSAAVTIANPIRVTDNKSAGRSVIGGRTADASGFTGAITLEKDVTFEAAAGGTVTVSGAIADAEGTGMHRLYVDGPGKVVFNTDVAGRTIDFSRVSEAELESSGFSSVTLASGLTGATVVLPDASSFEMWRVYTRNGRVRASRNGFSVLVR